MTRDEWLKIGYENNLITEVPKEACLTFGAVYKMWFKTKMHKVKPDTLDRIEVTYNKYYRGKDIVETYVHQIDKMYVVAYLNVIIMSCGIDFKEYARIYQIINNVLVYALDMSIGYAKVIDWGYVKRSVYVAELDKTSRNEYIISDIDIDRLFSAVLDYNVYPYKYSACLCILMNFYLGLRIGELASLTFGDFDTGQHVVFVRSNQVKYYNRDEDGERHGPMGYQVVSDLKTAKSKRIVPLTSECMELYGMLKTYHSHKGYTSPYIAYDGTDTILVRSLDRTLRRLCKLCGISHINSHRIRKTYASRLHMAGVPTRVISDLCGHSDMETTERCYILNYEGGYSRYMEVINSALSVKK